MTLEPYSSTKSEVGTLVAALGTGHVAPIVARGWSQVGTLVVVPGTGHVAYKVARG